MNNLYLYINLCALSIPFVAGFFPMFKYYRNWKYLFPGILIMSAIFIPWDIGFTEMGVWGFNPKYLTGITLVNLPVEEWLFFLCIPYSSVFIYFCLRKYSRQDMASRPLIIILALALLAAGLLNADRYYTAITFTATGIYLILHLFWWRSDFLKRFMIAYIITLLPFFIVNGLLTGSFIDGEVVWYNAHHILGIRLGTIPIEDTVYGLLMLLIVVHVYEWLQNRNSTTRAQTETDQESHR